MRVLIVEDHARLARAVAEGLRREGMAVDLSFDGADALAHVALNRYDVVVLDCDLPAVHGDQVCRKLVEEQSETRDVDADRRYHDQRTRGGSRAGRRRLPAQAIRVR
jgi:DNA-binding response OmpR family regulator